MQDTKNAKRQTNIKHGQNTMTISKEQIKNKLMIETNNYLNYIEINEGLLDIFIKFPSKSRVSLVEGKMKRILR